jgi:hypothetical protein
MEVKALILVEEASIAAVSGRRTTCTELLPRDVELA